MNTVSLLTEKPIPKHHHHLFIKLVLTDTAGVCWHSQENLSIRLPLHSFSATQEPVARSGAIQQVARKQTGNRNCACQLESAGPSKTLAVTIQAGFGFLPVYSIASDSLCRSQESLSRFIEKNKCQGHYLSAFSGVKPTRWIVIHG